MKDDEFTKLFRYMEKRFDDMDKRFDDTSSKQQVDHLISTIDHFVARLDTNETEQIIHNAQLDRLLDWARKVSVKTGIPLENL